MDEFLRHIPKIVFNPLQPAIVARQPILAHCLEFSALDEESEFSGPSHVTIRFDANCRNLSFVNLGLYFLTLDKHVPRAFR